MNIMVFDVPAESGGALSVLKDFYDTVYNDPNTNVNWHFVVSVPNFTETDNIKIIRFPWIKKSWIHRYFFDNLLSPILVKKYKIDKVFSLQNLSIPYVKQKQTVYIHNSLPFVRYRYKLLENKYLWFYQNIIGQKIIKSITKSDQVIVQTHWMKRASSKKAKIKENKIRVIPPYVNIPKGKNFQPNENSFKTFFYPANGSSFKNHRIIIEACKILLKQGIDDFKVIFTLNGDENDEIKRICDDVSINNLPVSFVGHLNRSEVFDYYTKTVLIFASFIETFGLPMLEAKMLKSIVIASDTEFSHEILDGYENSFFFNPFNEKDLALKMEYITTRRTYVNNSKNEYYHTKNTWEDIIEILIK